MELTALVATLKSGKIRIIQNEKETVEVNIQDKKIDANVKNKEFLKEIVSGTSEAKKGTVESIHRGIDMLRETRKSLPLVKELADDLCREGVTITVSYKGSRVITVGSEANAKLTRIITRTKGVEINSPRKLVEMGI